DRAVALTPQQAGFYSNRGRTWLLKGDLERALADLNPAISLNRNLDEAWVNRGVVWFLKEDFAKANADFDEALKLNPRLCDTYCSRGAALLAQDKLAEAEADFARCRALGGTPKPNAEKLPLEMEGRRRRQQ
ncbi:MAG TPA: tetratricopeptide repeat protein, partial [Blastocatellia bacterium]|nr:tetratricopeptide repeat protein [Blastocatellia bacterium]